jgi:hypothetical protein
MNGSWTDEHGNEHIDPDSGFNLEQEFFPMIATTPSAENVIRRGRVDNASFERKRKLVHKMPDHARTTIRRWDRARYMLVIDRLLEPLVPDVADLVRSYV